MNRRKNRPARKTPFDADYIMGRSFQEPNSGCWLWEGGVERAGYGCAKEAPGFGAKSMRAHRLSWTVHFGPVPAGLDVCHKCDVRCCVNPDHLFVGTRAENLADMDRKGRRPLGEKSVRAKLKGADIPAIRERYASGESPTAIGADFGVTHGAVRFVATRRSWAHIP